MFPERLRNLAMLILDDAEQAQLASMLTRISENLSTPAKAIAANG